MANSGRPRRVDAPRDDKGRILRRYHRAMADAPGNLNRWNRIRDVLVDQADQPELGTLLGRAFIIGDPVKISAAEFEAGERFAAILDAYDGIVLGITRSIRSPDFGTSVDGSGAGEGVREPTQDVITEITNSMMEAERVLGEAGPGVASATKALCRDESAALGRLASLGLQALADYWKIDGAAVEKRRERTAKRRNRENDVAGR